MAHRRLFLIILLIASISTHFAFFGHPNQTVFDEVHFGKFVSAYYTQEYYFDIHPPLGKLMIAGFAKLFQFKPAFDFAKIGEPFPDNKYLSLRFLPTIAGIFLPIIIFLLALELGFTTWAAFTAGALIVLENALLTQSRYILLDIFLLDFGFSTLLFYFRWKNRKNLANLLWMAIFGGLAISIKWTGAAFLGLTGIIELIEAVRFFAWRKIGQLAIYFIAIPILIYFSIFTIHFHLLPKAGEGDAFMSQNFRQKNVFQKFIELNQEMYNANKTLTTPHSYSSKWYTWPFMIRPIYYWLGTSTTSATEQKIYFIGNPFIWWGSTVAFLYLFLNAIGRKFFKDKIRLILLGGYLINYLPFIGIGRVMFLYHYLSALIFAILIFAYCLSQIKKPRNIFIFIISVSALAFLYFAPLTYGLSLSSQAFMNRMWLKTWQ
jgi:dolichyl-phosphate-mannose-protein mannosyltransferase